MRTLILHNEAVAALRDPRHQHHRQALAYLEANRAARRADKDRRTVVPTAVRVEAGWDRTDPATAPINRLNVADASLDPAATNTAAALAVAHSVSVADAHIGAVIAACAGDHVSVLTSDPDDMRLVAGAHPVNVLTL
jgi:hypothetical protein